MIVFLEGADGVGKSTLADAVEAHHSGTVIRVNNGPPPTDVPPYLHYSCMIDDIMRLLDGKSSRLAIVDRFHVGELIYAPMFRGTQNLSLQEAVSIDEELDALPCVKIHCTLSTAEIQKRQLARDGGKPDVKSGATLEYAPAIRAAFQWACGSQTRSGALPGWVTLDMGTYPSQIASTISELQKWKLQSFRG